MKKNILLLTLVCLPMMAAAQSRFGYFSYQEVLTSMEEYQQAAASLEKIKGKYNAEIKRVEDEFNNKYEQFLEGQKTFAPSIFKKRQEELQLLIESNLKFKTEAQRQIAQAEKEVFAPVHQQLGDAVRKVGRQKQLKAIFNTDNNAVPYLSEDLGIDVTNMIKEVLLKP